MKVKRKIDNKNEINEKIKQWEDKNPVMITKEPLRKVENDDKRQTMDQIKLENQRLARLKCGLSEDMTDLKSYKEPSLAYVYDPPFRTKSDLREKLHKENLEQQRILNSKVHKDEVARLNEREDEVFALLYSDQDRFSLSKLKNQRKKENLEYNLNTFSRKTIGVHGHELPKFSENEEYKEYWKNKEGYLENPKVSSLTELKENIKYWKKSEDLLLNDHRDYTEEPGKKIEKPQKVKDEDLIIKVNKINIFKDFDPNKPKEIIPGEQTKKHKDRLYSLI